MNLPQCLSAALFFWALILFIPLPFVSGVLSGAALILALISGGGGDDDEDPPHGPHKPQPT